MFLRSHPCCLDYSCPIGSFKLITHYFKLTSISLSARLYEHTSETRYLSTAILSAEFIKNHLYDGLIILDAISLSTCARIGVGGIRSSGYAVDGFSSLAVVNGSYAPLYVFAFGTMVLDGALTCTVVSLVAFRV